MHKRLFLVGITFVLLSASLLLCAPIVLEEEVFITQIQEENAVLKAEPYRPSTLLFVGDIMLGRKVEIHMEQLGSSYPFINLSTFLSEPDLTVANFEGVVAKEHVPTPSMGFQFSIKEAHIPFLKELGIDLLSLANNHSLDFGTTSLAYTRSLCDVYMLICAGTPKVIDDFTTTVIDVRGTKVGFIFLETIFGFPEESEVLNKVMALRESSDVQVAYIHWGDEYILTHNRGQEQFAQLLIDSGVDAVIGHHPHVIQDIALYNGKPIFYSLGNFIFDQYFSVDVQTELALHMKINESDITYSLTPFTSTTTQSQPDFMTDVQKQALFQRIFQSATQTPAVNIEKGVITVMKD